MSTALGNLTRYQNFRKFAERDAEIEFLWAPVKHYIAPGEHDPFKRWPLAIRSRATVFYQASPVLRRLSEFDAVFIHMYEVDIVTALRSYLFAHPPRIVSTDDAPVLDPSTYPIHPVDQAKPAWKRALRLRIDLWRARKANALIPFSHWAGNILVHGAGISKDRVTPIHVGIDLSLWHFRPREVPSGAAKVQLLFVGGDFERKGGALLLDVFSRHFCDRAELHIVTQGAPSSLPRNVHAYDNLDANNERLMALYRCADIFVLPTTADLSSWVLLEAMASGCATIATPVGGIVDILQDGITGLLVPPGDAEALTVALRTLIDDPARRIEMGVSGRRAVEQHFNAEINVPKILQIMKSAAANRVTR